MREIEEPTGPAVSVIVPVYNTRAELVSACVDSILAQTLVDFEIILANDGSEQSVTEGLDALADCDGRIRVLHLSHGGQAAAREAAVLDAQGEYVAFVDSDDEVLPKFLEEAVSIARAEQADYVNGTALVIGSDGVGGGVFPATYSVIDDPEALDVFRASMLSYLDSAQAAVPKVLSRSCWCSLYKLELLRKSLGGKMIFNGEDGLFNFCYLGECDCIVQATNVWYLYKDTQGSMSKSIHLKRREVDLDTVRDLDVAGRFENARRAFECHLALEAAELMYLSGEYGPVPAARFLGEQAAKGGCFERLDASEFSLDPRRRVVYGLCRDGRFRHALRASQVIRMLQGIRANIKGTIRPGRRP